MPPLPDAVKRDDFIAADQYFTVWFNRAGERYGATAALVLDAGVKPDLLIAHGDVVVTGERLAATDRPGLR